MLSGYEGFIVLAVIALLFGSNQIPKLARNLGLAQKELKDALNGDNDDDKAPTPDVKPVSAQMLPAPTAIETTVVSTENPAPPVTSATVTWPTEATSLHEATSPVDSASLDGASSPVDSAN